MINNSFTCFTCIIPTLTKDYTETHDHLFDLFDMFTISKLVIIGPEKLRSIVENDASARGISNKVEFINGNDIIPFESVQAAYDNRLNELTESGIIQNDPSSAGWYYQQFIKIAYSNICETDYYLCWDADTIPLRKTDMFNENGEPYLDLKTEYIPSYFKTIRNLFGFGKMIEKSFISGHMLFNKKYIYEMIDDIMSTDFRGTTFYEKIFSAMDEMNHGFSEFETYGNWIAVKRPGSHRLRNRHLLRNASLLIKRTDLTKEDLEWLATGFEVAGFERYQDPIPELTELFRSPKYRQKMTSDVFFNTLLESGILGEYKNGGLIVGDIICPA